MTYLKIGWKVDSASFWYEYANCSNISGFMIGWSWKIKFGKINYFFGYTNFEFSKLDFLTSTYHNSTNTGAIDMIFTKKCNYFSRGTRWDHPFLSQSQYKGCFGSLNEVEQLSLEMTIIFLVKIWIQRAGTPLLMGLRQKWMIPFCCPWKVVKFFGKEHANKSSINRVMLGLSWKIKFWKINYLFGQKINLKCQNTFFYRD